MKTENRNKRLISIKRAACAVTALSIIAASSVMLTGCGGKETSSSSDKITVSIANWDTKDPGLTKMNNRKAKFEEANPDIEIVPDTWRFDLETFYPKAAAGLLPNYFTAYYSEINNLISTGYLADITEVTKEVGIYDKINPVLLDMVTKDGKLYAIPNDSYTLGIAVNMDMFRQAGYIEEDGTPHQPKDWYELAEMAQKIKQVTGKPGFVMPTSNNSGGWIFTQIAWGFGVNFMEKDGDKWKATFNTPECEAALQYVKDLKWKYDALPTDIIVTGSDYVKIFATGGAAMTFGEGSMPRSVLQYDMNKDKLGLVAIPAGPKGRYSLLGGMLICFSNKTNEDQQRAIYKWLDLTNIDDDSKASYASNKQKEIDAGIQVGPKNIQMFTKGSARQDYYDQWRLEHSNVPEANYKLYNDSLEDPSITLRAEEPCCAQDLYGILDGCIQQVLQNENADCKAILEEANRNFQQQYLDDVEN